MGVNEDTMDEIFNERAYYLSDMDKLLLKRLDEQVSRNRMSTPQDFFISMEDRLEAAVSEY
ncbi:MAG: hypothetical protein MPEBLZ_03899 [Candidatus Methanoperedens nitroreducens]|uniref:Uncharacterized protein n=1 Tax=Candidatus Methanoperedens nitratireducens TaxID=1392998 RepID=A0A0P8CFX7_9EURY|nr:hypothetical protein [Candidatus Methanoperedens sp. BLZ2]KAB2947740.1 MAG: hypothetical protein F9K14_02715 [Candidatus Methanoperedens sp.]KPQ41536.1 MAG: hypothetical protein MPEBLZ_03899 [Candidatus Methanoperedens sp. BLZ1]MBZ0176194.1 hypothetical protein [Candidatus Methanoperedens nitroreducens]CAG0953695.1 hypothetical protein METP2_00369 [Methanosarcinales archaeon]MCX9077421.1 hypothetical protein [Candidatus Methanoperedens sp.]